MDYTTDLKKEFEILGLGIMHAELVAGLGAYWDRLPEGVRLYMGAGNDGRSTFILGHLWEGNHQDISGSHPQLWVGEKTVLVNMQLMTARRTASLRAKKLEFTPLGGDKVEFVTTLEQAKHDLITVVPEDRAIAVENFVSGYCRAHCTRSVHPLCFGDFVTIHAHVRQFCGAVKG